MNLPGEGNSVANYKTKIEYCGTCDGLGKVQLDGEELRDYLNGAGLSFKERREIVKSGEAVCRDCDGVGKFERWY